MKTNEKIKELVDERFYEKLNSENRVYFLGFLEGLAASVSIKPEPDKDATDKPEKTA